MAVYFEKPSNPEFSEQVERFETTETGHADTFNKRVEQLFHNELALRKAIEGVYQQASGYTDAAIAKLIGGAPSTLDTLKEIADAIEENQDVVEALDAAIGSKASEQEFEAHRVNSNIHVTADEKERLAEIYNTYQKKNAVDDVVYEELFLTRIYALSLFNNELLLVGTLKLGESINVSCKVNTYGDIIQEEVIRISWNSGEGSVTCVNDVSMSTDQIPVICMYKNGMYCINVMEVLKQVATFAFSRIEFRSKSAGAYIFNEKIAGAHGVVANLMKQIGTTPLGFGNGTLTGATYYLYRELYKNIKGILTTSLSGTVDRNRITRMGNIVMVEFRIYDTSFSGFNSVIANIPEEFRPSQEVNIVGYAHTAAGGQFACPYKIGPNGNVTQWYSSAEFVQFGIFGTYIIS